MALQELKDSAVKGLDDAFSLGVGSVVPGEDPTPFSQIDIDNAVSAAKVELKALILSKLAAQQESESVGESQLKSDIEAL